MACQPVFFFPADAHLPATATYCALHRSWTSMGTRSSPAASCCWLGLQHKWGHKPASTQVGSEEGSQVRFQVGSEVGSQVRSQVRVSQVASEMWGGIKVGSQVNTQPCMQPREGVSAPPYMLCMQGKGLKASHDSPLVSEQPWVVLCCHLLCKVAAFSGLLKQCFVLCLRSHLELPAH